MGDIDYAIKICMDIASILKSKVGVKNICVTSVLGLVNDLCAERGIIDTSKIIEEEIQEICDHSKNSLDFRRDSDFESIAIELFGYPTHFQLMLLLHDHASSDDNT